MKPRRWQKGKMEARRQRLLACGTCGHLDLQGYGSRALAWKNGHGVGAPKFWFWDTNFVVSALLMGGLRGPIYTCSGLSANSEARDLGQGPNT